MKTHLYKINHKEDGRFSLTLPSTIANRIPDHIRFVPEVTEEGILYRAVRPEQTGEPKWLGGVAEPPVATTAPKPKPKATQSRKPARKQKMKIANPDAPATNGQRWAIFCGYGVDTRPLKDGFTAGEASRLIDASKEGTADSNAVRVALIARGAIDKK